MKLKLFLITLLVPLSLQASSGIRSGRLSNGMDVVLVENHSVPMIAANIIVKIGARDETWQTWGSAHFLEHLLFNGTKTRTQEEIYAGFDRIGAYNNAHTGSHFTDFMVLVEKDKFVTGFDILADMVFASILPEAKVEKERGIVIEEIARSNTSDDGVQRMFGEILYGNSPLSREVLGTTESISRLERDSVMAFYKRWYQPNNSMLFATGDFDADSLFDWFNERLSPYPPAEIPPRRTIESPDFNSLSSMGTIVKETPGRMRKVMVAMAAPKPGSPEFVAFMLQLRALDKRFEANLPSGVSGGTDLSLDPDVSVATITLSAPKEGPDNAKLVSLLDAELERLINKPVDKNEIARLTRGYLAEQVYNTERLHYYGMMYASYWAVVSWDEFASWNDRMAKMSPEQLQVVTKKWLLTPARLLVAIEPGLEAKSEIASEYSGSTRRSGEGMPTVIVKSDPTARVFAVHVLAKDRWLWDRVYHPGSVDLLHRTLGEAVAVGQKLGNRLETLAATIKTADSPAIPYDDYYTAPEYSFVRFELLPGSWKEGVDILAELLLTTPLTEELVSSAKEGVAAGRAASFRNPAGVGIGKLRENAVGSTSLAAPVYGDVEKVSLAEIERLRTSYLHPENLIITVSGPVPAEEAADAVVKSFAKNNKFKFEHPEGWGKPERSLRSVSLRDTIILGKPQGAVVMGKVLVDVSPADRASLTIANSWFSERMGMVLRETRGLAYSLGSSVIYQRGEKDMLWGLWEISIGTRPEKLSESESGINELLDVLQTHVFTTEEIEKLSAAIAGRLMMRDMARIGQAFAMGTGEYYWSDPDSRAHLIEAFRSLTPESVKAAAEKYLTKDGLATIIVK